MVRLIAPPTAPVDAHGDWTAVERELGVRLPDDYKWLVSTYGWGEFRDFLNLPTPFGTNRHRSRRFEVAGRPFRSQGRGLSVAWASAKSQTTGRNCSGVSVWGMWPVPCSRRNSASGMPCA
jgi:SUKH superfamily protein